MSPAPQHGSGSSSGFTGRFCLLVARPCRAGARVMSVLSGSAVAWQMFLDLEHFLAEYFPFTKFPIRQGRRAGGSALCRRG